MSVLERIRRFLRPRGPETLMSLARSRRMPSTSRLYIVQVDFAVSEKAYENLEGQLDEMRAKYGLDFLVLEPGIRLTRFDEY